MYKCFIVFIVFILSNIFIVLNPSLHCNILINVLFCSALFCRSASSLLDAEDSCDEIYIYVWGWAGASYQNYWGPNRDSLHRYLT